MKRFNQYIKSTIIILIVSLIFSLILCWLYSIFILDKSFILEEINNINFWIRFMLFFVFLSFICCHFIFRIDKFYNWLYKYRYYLGLFVIIFAIVFELNNSSIDLWNILNTGNAQQSDIILGKSRIARYDEWSIYTPMLLSQNPKYQYFSDVLRGGNTDVFMIYGQPIKNIVSFFRPFLLGFLFLDSVKGLSFFWIVRLVLLFLVSFEVFLLISKQNKMYSLFGALLITFAPAVQWWWTPSGLVEIIIYGGLLVLLLNEYMTQKKFINRFLILFLFMIFSGSYLFVLYPAWQVPMAYIIVIIVLWIIMENYKNYKFDKRDIIPISIFSLLFIIAMIYIYSKSKETIDLITHTAYPGTRFETGGDYYTETQIACNSFIHVFRYWGNMFLALTDKNLNMNQCNIVMFFDLFPTGLIVSFIVLFKDKIKDKLLIMLLCLYLFFALWHIVGFPKFLAQITLLKVSPMYRTFIILSFLNVLILVRSISLVKYKMSVIYSLIFSFLISSLVVVSNIFIYKDYFDFIKIILVFLLSFVLYYLILRNKINKLFIIIVTVIMLVSGLFVNPIQKGINIVNNLEVSKVIKKINTQKEGIWIVENFNFFIINFPIMQGATTLNSTNTYPNINFFEKLDKDKKYNKVYNRYAHILIKLIHPNNLMDKFVLLAPDCFQINMTTNELLTLDIDYILTSRNLDEFNDGKINFKNIFYGKTKKFDIYIYRIDRLS